VPFKPGALGLLLQADHRSRGLQDARQAEPTGLEIIAD